MSEEKSQFSIMLPKELGQKLRDHAREIKSRGAYRNLSVVVEMALIDYFARTRDATIAPQKETLVRTESGRELFLLEGGGGLTIRLPK